VTDKIDRKEIHQKKKTKRTRRRGNISTNYGKKIDMQEEREDKAKQERHRLFKDIGDFSKLEHTKSGAGNQRSGENNQL
jgi:hypothetical protein